MTVATMTAELFVAIVFAVINLQIQIRFMAWWWARGCTWRQFLDVYDLGDKHKKWMTIDIITNSAIMFLTAALGWTLSPTIALGLFGVEAISLVCLPLRFAGAKRAVRHNPNLLDFNGKYKGTHEEYKKLLMTLEEKNLGSYKKSASKLWSELLLLNKRRNDAYENKKKLEAIKADVQKLINAYSMENDVDKRLKAQARLNKIIKQQADIDEFTKNVEEQIMRSENAFMDMRTKIAVGQNESVFADLSKYTNQVKSLEITVDCMDGNEIGEYGKNGRKISY